MKRAILFGSAGQDGPYLCEQLVAKGCAVVGVDVAGVSSTDAAMALPTAVDLSSRSAVDALIGIVRPEFVFYLAAFHHSSDESAEEDVPELLRRSVEVNVGGFAHVLDALRAHAPAARACYAASSHVFGEPKEPVQTESTPFAPTSIYGITKAAGVELARFYRRRGLHVSTAFLYNHESPRRASKFVSQRIARAAREARRATAAGQHFLLELGSLSAVVDWGYAPDYTDAMLRIVSYDDADDYVVATGIPHTVEEFCAAAFRAVGLDHRVHVRERADRLTRQLPPLVGDASKLRRRTGWAPSISFEEMVVRLVRGSDS